MNCNKAAISPATMPAQIALTNKIFNHDLVAGKSHRVALVMGCVMQGGRLRVPGCKQQGQTCDEGKRDASGGRRCNCNYFVFSRHNSIS